MNYSRIKFMVYSKGTFVKRLATSNETILYSGPIFVSEIFEIKSFVFITVNSLFVRGVKISAKYFDK